MSLSNLHVGVCVSGLRVHCYLVCFWHRNIDSFVESFSHFLSSVAGISIRMYFLSCFKNNFCFSATSFQLFLFLRVVLPMTTLIYFMHEEHSAVILCFFSLFASFISVLTMQFLMEFDLWNSVIDFSGMLFKGRCRFQYVDDIFLKLFGINVSVLYARL